MLSVLCGSVGVFELEVPFDAERSAAYEEGGTSYLNRLAEQVRYSPGTALRSGLARPAR